MKREYDFRKAKRGAVVSVPKGKTRITIRLDDEILAWFRDQVELAGGGNYQTVINEVLRQHIQRAQEPLEKTLRRVIRKRSAGRPSLHDRRSPGFDPRYRHYHHGVRHGLGGVPCTPAQQRRSPMFRSRTIGLGDWFDPHRPYQSTSFRTAYCR